MPPSRRHEVNSWLGVMLLCSITIWVTIFYIREANKLTESEFITGYRDYYTLLD